MLDQQARENFFQQIHDLWIQPELDRRFGESGIPDSFQIREALIKLPSERSPIVEFNDEIHWILKFDPPPNVNIEIGQLVHLHEISDVIHAIPPMVEEQRVAFVYLFWSGYSYKTIFDFSPNHPNFNTELDDFRLGDAIADHVRAKFRETVAILSKKMTQQLQKMGLWTATSLLLYPMSKIIERIEANDLDEARRVLVSYCDTKFLANRIVGTWKPIHAFHICGEMFDDALFMHQNGRYHGSINTLIQQIEGVIADWLHEIIRLRM